MGRFFFYLDKLIRVGGGSTRRIDGRCAAPRGFAEIVERVRELALIDVHGLIGMPLGGGSGYSRASPAFSDELAFGFEPNFFIAADGTIACVPDFPSASGDVIMGRLDPSGGRVHKVGVEGLQLGIRARHTRDSRRPLDPQRVAPRKFCPSHRQFPPRLQAWSSTRSCEYFIRPDSVGRKPIHFRGEKWAAVSALLPVDRNRPEKCAGRSYTISY